MPELTFLIFWIFLLFFFWNFLAQFEYVRNSGLKFFSLFFSVSHPVLAKNYAGMRFFNFLNFFTIFLGIFLPGSCINGIQDYDFFFSFSAYLVPFWLKILPEWGFLIFWFFFYFFRNCLLGSIMNGIREENFFLAFSAYLIPFWLKIMPERGFWIFWIFLLFF